MSKLTIDEMQSTGIEAPKSELGERAAALVPLLLENADRADRERRIPTENIEAITDAGLLRLLVPQRLGGEEADVRTFLDVSSQLGRGCGSTAWTTAVLNTGSWLMSLFPEVVQQEVFGDSPDVPACTVAAPTGSSEPAEGGWSVSGRWGFATGCWHAQWALCSVPVFDDAGDAVGAKLALIPMDEIEIEETWFVAGMRGTGSNTIIVQDSLVPENRFLSSQEAVKGNFPTEYGEEHLARVAFAPVNWLTLVGPQLGLARAALDFVIEKAPSRAISHTTYDRQADSAAFQVQLAEAAARIDSAYLLSFHAADQVDRAAEHGVELDLVTRARMRSQTAYAVRLCGEAIEILLSAHGTSSFADVNPLQRIWRDQSTGRRHAGLSDGPGQEVYGKALLGVSPNITRVL